MRRKMILVCAFGAILMTFNIINNNNIRKHELERYKTVLAYVKCLEESFVQRDYCARKVSKTNYRFLDQDFYNLGFSYEQVGYDLYIVYP